MEDFSGNGFAGVNGPTAWDFTTTDVPPLVVTGASPELTGTLPPFSTFDVTFNKPIDPATFETRDLGLLDLGDLDVSWLGSFGGTFFDCALDGSRLYAATSAGLQILDVSDPTLVTRLGGYETSNWSGEVRIVGNVAYVPDGYDGLQILDVSDPAAVTRLGGYDTPGYAAEVELVDNLAYVADGSAGLQILDVSDPAAVTRLGWYNTLGSSYGVQVVGNSGLRGRRFRRSRDPGRFQSGRGDPTGWVRYAGLCLGSAGCGHRGLRGRLWNRSSDSRCVRSGRGDATGRLRYG